MLKILIQSRWLTSMTQIHIHFHFFITYQKNVNISSKLIFDKNMFEVQLGLAIMGTIFVIYFVLCVHYYFVTELP